LRKPNIPEERGGLRLRWRLGRGQLFHFLAFPADIEACMLHHCSNMEFSPWALMELYI